MRTNFSIWPLFYCAEPCLNEGIWASELKKKETPRRYLVILTQGSGHWAEPHFSVFTTALWGFSHTILPISAPIAFEGLKKTWHEMKITHDHVKAEVICVEWNISHIWSASCLWGCGADIWAERAPLKATDGDRPRLPPRLLSPQSTSHHRHFQGCRSKLWPLSPARERRL